MVDRTPEGDSYDRWFVLDRADIDEDSRELELSFSSDEPVERWFGWEVLRHNRQAVKLGYLRSVGTFLFNHDPENIVGPIKSISVEGGKLRARVGFGDTPEGNLRLQQVQDGSLRGVSIRYVYGPDDYRDIDDGQEEFGAPGRGREVKRWTPIHLTLSPEPADASVGVGRSRDTRDTATSAPGRECESVQENRTMPENKKETTGTETKETPPAPVETAPVEPPQQEDREAILREERHRVRSIEGFGEMAGQPALARKLADAGATIESAHEQLRAAWLKNKKDAGDTSLGSPTPNEPSGRKFADVDGETLNRTFSRRSWHDDRDGVLGLDDLRSYFRADPGGFDRRLKKAFGKGDLKPEQFSLRALWQAFGDTPCQQWVHDPKLGEERAITTTAFATLTGNTVVAKLRESYENVPQIGDQLTRPFPSNNATDTVVGIMLADAIKAVDEGKAYEEAGGTEDFVTVTHRKQGGIIRVTDEMIRFDQTGQFLTKINALGEQAGLTREKLIIYRVCDDQGYDGRYVYHPAGTATSLYSATARARGTNLKESNALVDTTDLANARALLAAMTNRSGGDKINVQPKILLVPDALIGTALVLRGSELLPGSVNEMNPWGTRGQWQPKVLSSPVMDSISTSTWYLGDPSRQFWRKELIALETTQQGASAEAMFTHDIAAQFKVRFDIEVFCDDYVHFVENTA